MDAINDGGKKVDKYLIKKALNWSYDAAIDGIPGMGTSVDLANYYLMGNKSLDKKVDALIRWQNTKCATSGFIGGLGGLITLPVALPVNITSVLYVQTRMIAAIAHMGDHDIRDDRVKTLVYLCLLGASSADLVKDIGIQTGTKLAKSFIEKNVSGKMLTQINQKVGFRLLTKFGEKGVINLGKAVPIVGGLVGGAIDAVSTNTIGNMAKKTFI